MYPEDRLAVANDLRARGKCSKAVLQYEQLLSEFPKPEVAEQAKFNLAGCRMELEEYDLARREFEVFIDSYPRSELVDDAMYMIGLTYLEQAARPERDQTQTLEALSELELLIREYPNTDLREAAQERIAECKSRLAEKDYLNGELYLRLGYYSSAHVYFDSVISQYGDTSWAGRALLGKGIAFEGQNQPEKARQVFRQVLDEFPSGGVAQQAARRLEELGGESNGRGGDLLQE